MKIGAASEVIARARAMTCNLVAVNLRLSEIRSMINALRALASSEYEINFQAPINAYLAPFFHPDIAWVTAISKG